MRAQNSGMNGATNTRVRVNLSTLVEMSNDDDVGSIHRRTGSGGRRSRGSVT